MKKELALYHELLDEIKSRVRLAQTRAALSANAEMILLYWDIGRMIAARQEQEGWGKGLLSRLATDLKNEIPEIKGFSERNLQLMIQFQSEYPTLFSIPQRPVAELPESAQSAGNKGLTVVRRPADPLTQGDPSSMAQRAVAQLSWGHNVILIQKVKDRILAEYALRDIHKPIGVADYELTRALPQALASSLPSIEDIEAELMESLKEGEA